MTSPGHYDKPISMQGLGLSGDTPRTDGRLKSLLWPTIANRIDLDTVTTQGFWICTLVGAMTLMFSFFAASTAIIVAGCLGAAFYFLAAVGVRMHSRVAAAAACVAYFLDAAVMQKYTGQGFSVTRLIFLALLLANLRGIWLSASWAVTETDPIPVRLNETWRDKLCDQLPAVLWPRTTILFYVLAAAELGLLLLELFPFAHATSGGAAYRTS